MSDSPREKRKAKVRASVSPFTRPVGDAYDGWQNDFLDIFHETRTVAETCQRLGISQKVVREEAASNPVFRDHFEAEFEGVTDIIEKKALKLAVDGTKIPVVQQGQIVAYQQREYPELVQFLLRTRRPGIYSEKLRVAQTLASGDRGQSAAEAIVAAVREMRDSVGITAEPRLLETKKGKPSKTAEADANEPVE